MTATKRASFMIVAIAVAAFAFRVWVVAEVATREPTGGDPLYYHLQANLLASGHGYAEPFAWRSTGEITPSAVHPPGFTTWLAIASTAGFRSVLAHKVMSALAGALTVAVVGLLTLRLAGPAAGVVAAVLAAAYPNLWVIDGALMPEALFGLTVALVLFAAYWAAGRPTIRRALVLGGAVGAATLVRSEALLFAPLLGGWLAWRAGRGRAAIGVAAAVVGVAVLLLVPWAVRNAVRFDAPVLLSTNGDEVVRNANCDETWHGRLLGFWAVECYRPKPPATLDEAQRAAFWRRAGLHFVRSHLSRAPVVSAARVGRVWDLFRPRQNVELSTVEDRNLHVARAGQLMYACLVPLAVWGAVVARRRDIPLWPLLSTAVVVTATAVYAYGVIRFRVPAEIAIVVLAGIAVSDAGGRFA